MNNIGKNVIEVTSVVTGATGALVSMAQIETILGITLTCINIIYLLVLFGIKIYQKFKQAKSDGVITREEMQGIAEDIGSMKEAIEEEVNKHVKK